MSDPNADSGQRTPLRAEPNSLGRNTHSFPTRSIAQHTDQRLAASPYLLGLIPSAAPADPKRPDPLASGGIDMAIAERAAREVYEEWAAARPAAPTPKAPVWAITVST